MKLGLMILGTLAAVLFGAFVLLLLVALGMYLFYQVAPGLMCNIGIHSSSELQPHKCATCGADLQDWDKTL